MPLARGFERRSRPERRDFIGTLKAPSARARIEVGEGYYDGGERSETLGVVALGESCLFCWNLIFADCPILP